MLTKQAVPAPHGKSWTDEARQAQLRYWTIKDFLGVLFASIYCSFAFILAAAFLAAATLRDAKRLFFAVMLAHLKILVLWPILTTLLATMLGWAAAIASNMKSHKHSENDADEGNSSAHSQKKTRPGNCQGRAPDPKLESVKPTIEKDSKMDICCSDRALDRALELYLHESHSRHGKKAHGWLGWLTSSSK